MNKCFTAYTLLTAFYIVLHYVLTQLMISGIGMDASITPLRHGGLSLVQTTDFFYPLVEDPYMMGNMALVYFFFFQ